MSDELEENNNLSFLPTPLLNSTIGKKFSLYSESNAKKIKNLACRFVHLLQPILEPQQKFCILNFLFS